MNSHSTWNITGKAYVLFRRSNYLEQMQIRRYLATDNDREGEYLEPRQNKTAPVPFRPVPRDKK
jgi:hypothetical protein